MTRQRWAYGAQRSDAGENGGQSGRDAADYIASLTEQMALMARAHRLDMLAYLLEMALMEAEQLVRSSAHDH